MAIPDQSNNNPSFFHSNKEGIILGNESLARIYALKHRLENVWYSALLFFHANNTAEHYLYSSLIAQNHAQIQLMERIRQPEPRIKMKT